jgi:hypothetical protein
MILATYVDDMPWGSNDMALVHEVFEAMRKEDFKLTWHTDLNEVLGAQIQDVGDGIVLHQADYVNKIISAYASDIEQHEALLRGQVQTPCPLLMNGAILTTGPYSAIHKKRAWVRLLTHGAVFTTLPAATPWPLASRVLVIGSVQRYLGVFSLGSILSISTAYLAKDVIDAQESKIQTIADLDPKFATRYRSLVGGLLYVSVVSNPDISYTVGQLC